MKVYTEDVVRRLLLAAFEAGTAYGLMDDKHTALWEQHFSEDGLVGLADYALTSPGGLVEERPPSVDSFLDALLAHG